jgi:hypothetical protein
MSYADAIANTTEQERDGFEYRWWLEPDNETRYPGEAPNPDDTDAWAKWSKDYDRWRDAWQFVFVCGEMRHVATKLVVASVCVGGTAAGWVTPSTFTGLPEILAEMRAAMLAEMHGEVAQKAKDFRDVAELLDSFVPDEG